MNKNLQPKILALHKQGKTRKEIKAILGCSKNIINFHINPQIKINSAAYTKTCRAASKQMAMDYKGGKCQICNYSKCPSALDFHHIDPASKDMAFLSKGGHLNTGITFEKLKPELDKCILLCCRCHREIHAGVLDLPMVSQ